MAIGGILKLKGKYTKQAFQKFQLYSKESEWKKKLKLIKKLPTIKHVIFFLCRLLQGNEHCIENFLEYKLTDLTISFFFNKMKYFVD